MTGEIDQLRPLTAGRVLDIWRECRAAAEDALERTLLCNARVLAEGCYTGDEPAFADGAEVLARLTGREMEALLRKLAADPGAETVNPAFDPARFRELEG